MLKLAGALALAGSIAMSGAAQAATFYAASGGSNTPGCPGSSPCTLEQAAIQANAANGRDAVRVLGTLAETGGALDLSAAAGTDLIGSGAGPGGTLYQNATAGQSAVNLGARSSITGIRLVAAAGTDIPVIAGRNGVTIRSVRVESNTLFANGIALASGGAGDTLIQDASIAVPESGSSTGILVTNDPASTTRVEDTLVTAVAGMRFTNGTSVVRRSTVDNANQGIQVTAGGLAASSSVVRVGNNSAFGVRAVDGPGAELRQLTIVDFNDGSEGVVAQDAGASGSGGITLRGSVIHGFSSDLSTQGPAAGIDAGTSLYATKAGAVSESAGGNLVGADPGFVNELGADLRLRSSSPAIDAAGATPAAGEESAADRLGRARLIDGDGSGTAERDMGAFELRGLVAAVAAAPNPVAQKQPVSFDASGSAYPDGAIAGYAWDLDGNGSFETATGGVPRASRAYAAARPVPVAVRVTATDGVVATATLALTVQDVRRPRITGAAMDTPFAVARRSTALAGARRPRRGTTIRYRLSERSRVRIAIKRRALGRYARVGTIVRRGRPPGRNRTRFSGRLGRRPLQPGRYRAVITATDAAGNRSRPRTLRFRVVRP